MATGWAHSTKEKSNFARLCRLLIDGGTKALKDEFDSIHPPSSLQGVLHTKRVHSILKNLRTKRVLTIHQWNRLYPSIRTSVTSSSFDVTLLFILLRNICNLTPPSTGWDKPPTPTDHSKEADLARIKLFRNELYGHITETAISDSDFEKYWTDIEDLLLRLGGAHYKPDIERLKIEPMDPEDEEYFIKATEEWEQMEKRIISMLEELLNRHKPTIADDSQAKDYSNRLKSSIKSHTCFQTRMKEDDKHIRTDDIFTSVTIQRGQKQLKKSQAEPRIKRARLDEDELEPSKKVLVKKCSELFIFPENKKPMSTDNTNPKSILVTGDAGIGKSLFCQKLARDWANDVLFEKEENRKAPDFQFVFLLTFRQLNLLRQEMLDLREILNRSSLLNELSNLDEPSLDYILKNPEKLLIIIDGYDEYSIRSEITGDFELRYPNNPKEKMPVSAMVAKLMKGKILQDSVVMITSRPGEVNDMGEISFDAKVEITGFSSQQIMELIEKYFKDNEGIKNTVLEHFQLHEDLLGFCHVPVICFLMCYCLEWRITHSETTAKLPVTRTDLYHEVSKIFIKKHHVQLKYDEDPERKVEEMLDKLAELAGQLLQENKYIFDQEDLKKIKFSEEEMANLKESGLLCCFPGTRISPSAKRKLEFTFIHLTIQEYLAAHSFVEKREIPENTSDMVLQFMSGLLSKKQDETTMAKLMESVKPIEVFTGVNKNARLLTLKCLYEYGDVIFVKQTIKDYFCSFCKDGRYVHKHVADTDCIYFSFMLDIISALHEEQTRQHQSLYTQPFDIEILDFGGSFLTFLGVKRICKSLENVSCTVTALYLDRCDLVDECVEAISEVLLKSKLTYLSLSENGLTDEEVTSICESLKNKNCKLTSLDLSSNEITEEGITRICESLINKDCKLTRLDLNSNEITEEGITRICESLINKDCKLTRLDLSDNDIIDEGITRICESLLNKNCKLTSLDLSSNEITDEGITRICESLINKNCKLTILDLSDNEITDEGITRICESLINKNCKLTRLDLRDNQITDEGVNTICKTIIRKDCVLSCLDLSSSDISPGNKIREGCKQQNNNLVHRYKPDLKLIF